MIMIMNSLFYWDRSKCNFRIGSFFMKEKNDISNSPSGSFVFRSIFCVVLAFPCTNKNKDTSLKTKKDETIDA